MATFSVNQTNQVYVAKEYSASDLTDASNVGALTIKADDAKTMLYVQQNGAGGLVRSDIIDIKNILSVRATDASTMKTPLLRKKIMLSAEVNSGAPVSGQDYVLRITFDHFIGNTSADEYFKYAMVHAYPSMTASIFYKVLAESLVKNFSRENTKLLKFYLETSGTEVGVEGTAIEITDATKFSTLTDTYTGIILEEAEQEWTLGILSQDPVYYNVYPTTITFQGEELQWGDTAQVASKTSYTNGRQMADLEYFFMGERGDVYRTIGFPRTIHTEYMVNPALEYNVIGIHYAFVDEGISVQKSEKDITILVPKVGATDDISNALTNTIIAAITAKTGVTIPALNVV